MILMISKRWKICGALVLVIVLTLVLILLMVNREEDITATTIHLRKTEGTVQVSDDKNADLEPFPDMGLYSGYQVSTQSESYAWVDLDSVKLTKMDQETMAKIQKEGQKLEIIVRFGSLFFHVTEPLTDDESMNIRNSNMAVGIRGTCGWVEVPEGEDIMQVYLLEGKVECTANGEKKTVSAGKVAVMTESGDITVDAFSPQDIPDYIQEEIEKDDRLASYRDELKESPKPPVLTDGKLVIEQFRDIISNADMYIPYYNAAVGDFTGEFLYTLVQMQVEDIAPTLLLRAKGKPGNLDQVLVFRYDPDSQKTNYIPQYNNGVISMGTIPSLNGSGGDGYCELGPAPDGTGMLYIESFADSDGMQITLLTIELDDNGNDKLDWSISWGGDYNEGIPAEYQILPTYVWSYVEDTGRLDQWIAEKNSEKDK